MAEPKVKPYRYSEEEGGALLVLARSTIMDHLNMQGPLLGDGVMAETLRDSCFQYPFGNFVTLKIAERLRGCIGNLHTSEPVVEGVRANAINAAFRDSRFSPLHEEELPEVTIDISILTPPAPLPYGRPEELLCHLRRGVDGVVLKKGGAGATFLPQVWEQLPVPEQFLSQLCQKAGLPADA